MGKNRASWWEKGRFCLITLTQDGITRRHYYDTYEDLDYNATYCQFSRNIFKAKGMELIGRKWVCLFTIG